MAALSVISLLWAGMVIGVSGLATPIKFSAPALGMPAALDVGRVTFDLLNRVELGLVAALLLIGVAWLMPRLLLVATTAMAALLIVQTAWLLPALEARVDLIIAGGTPAPSSLHRWYIVAEAAKLITLLGIGIAGLGMLMRHPARN